MMNKSSTFKFPLLRLKKRYILERCEKSFDIYLFIQIAYCTHMGQAISIQKHANIKKKNNTNIINM